MLVLNDVYAEQRIINVLAHAGNLWRILSAKYGTDKGLRVFTMLVGEEKYLELQALGFTAE